MTISVTDGLALIALRASENRSLAVIITAGDEQDPQVSVVNAAIINHPVTGDPAVAFVSRRGPKLRNLRRHQRATLVFQAGWEWVATRGDIELSGPDDPHHGIDDDTQRQLLRTIYNAAGGSHSDFDQYDRAMLAERRCVVLLQPEHIWTNPPGSQHKEPGDLV